MELNAARKIWLVKGASFTLAPGLALKGGLLTEVSGHGYPLNTAGELLCQLGERPVDIERLIDVLAVRTNVERHVLEGQVMSFVAEMSSRGFVSVSQSFLREILGALRNLGMIATVVQVDRRFLNRSRFPLRYYRASVLNLLRACLEAHQGLLWTGTAVALLTRVLFSSNYIPTLNGLAPSTASSLPIAIMAYFLTFVSVAVAHEVGHFVVARRLGVDVTCVYARLGVSGVAFRAPNPRAALAILFAGPLSGILSLGILAGATYALGPAPWVYFGTDQFQLSWYAALGVLTMHQLLCLTPINKDGKQVLRQWAALRLPELEPPDAVSISSTGPEVSGR